MPPVLEGRIAIFGAGGPVGAVAAEALKDHYTLRLTDVRPLDEIVAEGKRQSPGAPLPEVLPPPHEWSVVDVTDYDQVHEAARGMDSLVNVTVVRPDLRAAFAVNMLGAYNVVKAAVAHGIRRIIHTGPQLVYAHHPADYWHEFGIHDDVPERPGSDLYSLTKYLGDSITRVYAERHGLEVAEFQYCGLEPATPPTKESGKGQFCFMTAWEDLGEPFLLALRAPSSSFERPLERFHIVASQPAGKFGMSDKAERLLGWTPRHDFAALWTRPVEGSKEALCRP
jgi:nucleoside-diphosphate-sugar epimerase